MWRCRPTWHPGTYYLGGFADNNGTITETDNNWNQIQVTVTASPTVVVGSVEVSNFVDASIKSNGSAGGHIHTCGCTTGLAALNPGEPQRPVASRFKFGASHHGPCHHIRERGCHSQVNLSAGQQCGPDFP